MEKIKRNIKDRIEIIKNRKSSILSNNKGIGVVEIILILVVLIGLVLIFKSQLTDLISDIFETIISESSSV